MAVMGPWEYMGIITYPDNEAALGRIAKFAIFETETFPAEDVETFFRVFV